MVALLELVDQLRATGQQVDHIVFGSSSGGTQAGILVGARVAGFSGRLDGISIDKNDPEHLEYGIEVAHIANACADYIGFDTRLTMNLSPEERGNGRQSLHNIRELPQSGEGDQVLGEEKQMSQWEETRPPSP